MGADGGYDEACLAGRGGFSERNGRKHGHEAHLELDQAVRLSFPSLQNLSVLTLSFALCSIYRFLPAPLELVKNFHTVDGSRFLFSPVPLPLSPSPHPSSVVASALCRRQKPRPSLCAFS